MDTSWEQHAACRDVPVDTFFEVDDFVDPQYTTRKARYAENTERRLRARLICSVCPVRDACLQQAFELDDQHAVRAGLTPEQRNRLKLGKGVEDVTEMYTNTRIPPSTRGWTVVRRFAQGERLAALCTEYGLSRITVMEEIRTAVRTGEWATTSTVGSVA